MIVAVRNVLLLLLAITALSAAPTARELFDRAQQLSKSGDAAGALQAYVEAVKLDPKLESWDFLNHLPEAIGQRGLSLGAERDKMARAAAPHLQEALRLYLSRHPDNYTATFLLGQSYGFTDQLAEAERLWNSYLARHPRSVRAVFDRDEILSAEKKYDEVIAAHEQLVRFYPCDENAKVGLAGMILDVLPNLPSERRGAILDRAELMLRQALAMDPELLGAMKGLAGILRQKGQNEQANSLEARWKELRTKRREQEKGRREWQISVKQESDDDPRFHSWDSSGRPASLRREPFLIDVDEPAEAPLRISVSGDDKVPHAVSPQATERRGQKYRITYAVTTIGKIPMAQTKDCRVYVTATRASDTMTLIVQPE